MSNISCDPGQVLFEDVCVENVCIENVYNNCNIPEAEPTPVFREIKDFTSSTTSTTTITPIIRTTVRSGGSFDGFFIYSILLFLLISAVFTFIIPLRPYKHQ